MNYERIDLHTHSTCSDGAMSPVELVTLAAERGVQLLALTDHDTLDGCSAAAACAAQRQIAFVPGIELTCTWREREIHVVGLGIELASPALLEWCATLQQRRAARYHAMHARLQALGIELGVAPQGTLTRMHLARQLLQQGLVRATQEAFDRWLSRGQPAYVAPDWPPLSAAVQCIVAAGGMPVLAHPHRYRCSNGQLRQLCAEFKQAGGVGMEVSLAGMSPGDSDRLCRLARALELAGSVASDFHEPGLPWRPLGRFAKLPEGVEPIWQKLATT